MEVLQISKRGADIIDIPIDLPTISKIVNGNIRVEDVGCHLMVYDAGWRLHDKETTLLHYDRYLGGRILLISFDDEHNIIPFDMEIWDNIKKYYILI